MSSSRQVFIDFGGGLRELVDCINSALSPESSLRVQAVGSGPCASEVGEGRIDPAARGHEVGNPAAVERGAVGAVVGDAVELRQLVPVDVEGPRGADDE